MQKRNHLFGVPPGQWLAAFVIVTIMCAFLYPVFQKSHDGYRPGCHRNLLQLGLAIVQYEQDANESFPSGTNAAGNGWAGQIYVFTRNLDAYKCPQDLHNGSYISYAENQNIAGQLYGNLTAPAGTVELYEFTTLGCDPSTTEAVSATGLNAPQDSARHDSSTFALNFVMVDGHVKHLTPGQVSGGINAVPPTHKGKYLATFAVK